MRGLHPGPRDRLPDGAHAAERGRALPAARVRHPWAEHARRHHDALLRPQQAAGKGSARRGAARPGRGGAHEGGARAGEGQVRGTINREGVGGCQAREGEDECGSLCELGCGACTARVYGSGPIGRNWYGLGAALACQAASFRGGLWPQKFTLNSDSGVRQDSAPSSKTKRSQRKGSATHADPRYTMAHLLPVQREYIRKQSEGKTEAMKDAARSVDKKVHAELNALRARACNAECFDCSAKKPGWAVLPHGVFVCIDCAQNHRSVCHAGLEPRTSRAPAEPRGRAQAVQSPGRAQYGILLLTRASLASNRSVGTSVRRRRSTRAPTSGSRTSSPSCAPSATAWPRAPSGRRRRRPSPRATQRPRPSTRTHGASTRTACTACPRTTRR